MNRSRPPDSEIRSSQLENEELLRRLEEAEETIRAIRSGAVDAFVVEEPTGHRVYTLEGAERPYRLFVEEMQQGAATLQPNGTIVWCNRQLAELLMISPKRLVGTMLQEFVSKISLPQFEIMLEGGRTQSGQGELQLKRSNGELIPTLLTLNLLPPGCGSAIGLLVTDLTFQRHHEDLMSAHTALRDSEALLQRNHDTFFNLIENAPFGVYVIDANFRLRQISAGSRKVFRDIYPLLDRDFAEILKLVWTEPFASEVIAHFRHTLKTGDKFTSAISEKRHGSDEIESYDWKIERITLPDGQFGVVCYFYDLTERQQAEVALRESEGRFRALADESPIFIWQSDENLNMTYANRTFHNFLGLRNSSEFSGTVWESVMHKEDVPRVWETYRHAVRERKAYALECRFRETTTGEFQWHLIKGLPRILAGRLIGFMSVGVNIHELKLTQDALRHSEETLARQNQSLEQMVEARTATLQDTIGELEAFSYTVSHDLRAPLRAMQGYAGALLEVGEIPLGEEQRGYAVRIRRAAERLDHLTQDILAYSRVSRAHYELHLVDLEILIADLLDQYPQFQENRSRITIEHPITRVLGHEGLLTQCFSNLLGNACKFVPPGALPEVRIRTVPFGTKTRIIIEDKGIGISPAHHGRIFAMFSRVHPDSKYDGTGIGLAIVKKAAERMDGTVGFESSPGLGSKFWLELKSEEFIRPVEPTH